MAEQSSPADRAKRERLEQLAQFIEKMDIKGMPDVWNKLKAISNKTEIDKIEVDPVGVTIYDDNKFSGVLSIYLILSLKDKRDTFVTSNSVSGSFKGHYVNSQPKIDYVDLNLRAFE